MQQRLLRRKQQRPPWTPFRRGREPRACGAAELQSATMHTSHPNSRGSRASSAGRAWTRTRASSSPSPRNWQPQMHARLTLRSNTRSRPEWTGSWASAFPKKPNPGRGRRPHTPRVLRPLPRGGPSRPERAFGVTGRSSLRARPLCTPGEAGRRWLQTNGGARAVPQHPQQRGPTVPGNRTNPGPVALARLNLRRELL